VTLATKIGYDFYNNPQAGHGELPKELDREYLETAFERSLDRLDTDYVDLLQLHNANVDDITPEVRDLLREWKADGRARSRARVGARPLHRLAGRGRRRRRVRGVDDVGPDRLQPLRAAARPPLRRHHPRDGLGTSVIARVPHSSGLLNEQVTPDTVLEDGDHRSHRPQEWRRDGWKKVDAIRFLEDPDGVEGTRTMAQAAIRWLLAHDEVASVTPTFRDGDDIAEWSAASDVPPLSEAEYDRVEELYARNFDIDRDDGMDAPNVRRRRRHRGRRRLDKRAASY